MATTKTQLDNETQPISAREQEYLEQLKQKQENNPVLTEFIKELSKIFDQKDQIPRQQQIDQDLTSIRYAEGDYYGKVVAGKWQSSTKNDEDFRYSVPLYKAHVEQAKLTLLKTQPEYEYRAVNEADTTNRNVARLIKTETERIVAQKWTPKHDSKEVSFMAITGRSFRELYFSVDDIHPKTAVLEIESVKKSVSPSQFMCDNCRTPYAQVGKCQKCGGNVMEIAGAETAQTIKEKQRIPVPEPQIRVLHPSNVQFDLDAQTFESSAFIIERFRITRREAEYKYKKVFHQSIASDVGNSSATQVRNQARNVTATSHNFSQITSDTNDYLEGKRMFLKEWYYGDYILPKDCEIPTLEGKKILKAGTRLIDEYPNGAYICVISDELVEIDDVRFIDKFTMTEFGTRPNVLGGTGITTSMQLQDVANDLLNGIISAVYAFGNPTTYMNGLVMGEDSVPTRVGNTIILENIPQDVQMQNLVMQLPPQSVHSDMFNLLSRIEGDMQYVNGTFSFNGGDAQIRDAMGTATGASAIMEMASGRMIEPVQSRKQADIKMRHQIAKMLQANAEHPYYQQRFINQYGEDTYKAFLECDIASEYVIEAKKGTDAPKSEAVNMQKMQMFSQTIPSVAGLPEASTLLTGIAETMNLPFSLGVGEDDKREAEYRIAVIQSKFAEAPQEMQMMADNAPQEFAQQIFGQVIEQCEASMMIVDEMTGEPTDKNLVLMQNHEAFQTTYKDWLQSEEGRAESAVVRGAVALMFALHFRRAIQQMAIVQIEQAKIAQEVQAMMTPPEPESNELTPEEQIEAEALQKLGEHELERESKRDDYEQKLEDDEIAHDRQKEMEREKFERELAKTQADREWEMTQAERQRQHEKEMKEMELAHQKEVAKSKPKEK